MEYAKTIDEYLSKNQQWEKELFLLMSIVRSTELDETKKWGIPVYTYQGKNIVGIAAFKNYVGLWFYNGALLKDEKNKLINAQEGTTKALRQWRFNSIDEIDNVLVKEYVMEAISNQKQGREIKPSAKKAIGVPKILEHELDKNEALKKSFYKLTAFKQREFLEYIEEAKQEQTKGKRLDKIIPMILEGIGLNDKYRKS